MSEKDDASSPRVSRRQYLSMTAVGASSVALMGSASGQTRDPVTIPFLVQDGDVTERKEVSRAWYEEYQQALRAKSEFQVRMANRQSGAYAPDDGSGQSASSLGVAIERSEEQFDGLSGFQINVQTDRPDDVPSEAVEGMGMDVSMESAPDPEPFACPNRGHADPLPGGFVVYGNQRGTVATTVRRDGEEYILTAGHLFWQDGPCTAETRQFAYVDDSDTYIGSVDEVDNEQDFVLVASGLFGGVDFANTIREYYEDGTTDTVPVAGHVTKVGVAYLESADETIRQTGSSSGTTTGEITKFGQSIDAPDECTTFGSQGVQADYAAKAGDSGGPVYYTYDGKAWMLGLSQYAVDSTTGGECTVRTATDDMMGTAAYHIADTYEVSFFV